MRLFKYTDNPRPEIATPRQSKASEAAEHEMVVEGFFAARIEWGGVEPHDSGCGESLNVHSPVRHQDEVVASQRAMSLSCSLCF